MRGFTFQCCLCRASASFLHSNFIQDFNCLYCHICSYTGCYLAYHQLLLKNSCVAVCNRNSMHWSPHMLTPGWEGCTDDVMHVSPLFRGWMFWIPSLPPLAHPLFFSQGKKKSNVHKQHLIGWFCHCLVGWGPFFKWMNLSYNSYLTALKQNRIRLTK